MNITDVNATISNREFVAMIRERLDADGHRDVAVRRDWIDTDSPEHPFLMNVPIGPDLVVPLFPLSGFVIDRDDESVADAVRHFSTALVNLKLATRTLTKYVEDVRRAARREIAAARASGLDLTLEGVGFQPIRAWHLSDSSWKEAATYLLASLRIGRTAFHLRPGTSLITVEEPHDVAAAIADLVKDQRERQAQLAAMDARGADLEVDALTLELLQAHQLDAVQLLRDAWKRQNVSVDVEHDGSSRTLMLATSQGRVTATVETGAAYWNGDILWLPDVPRETYAGLAGQSLGELAGHPAFASVRVAKVEEAHDPRLDRIHLDLSDRLLFDADTGRIWREDHAPAEPRGKTSDTTALQA